jgi:hypothetical protein
LVDFDDKWKILVKNHNGGPLGFLMEPTGRSDAELVSIFGLLAGLVKGDSLFVHL